MAERWGEYGESTMYEVLRGLIKVFLNVHWEHLKLEQWKTEYQGWKTTQNKTLGHKQGFKIRIYE